MLSMSREFYISAHRQLFRQNFDMFFLFIADFQQYIFPLFTAINRTG